MKLSDADDAFARGEYFDAQAMYRKVYNRMTKREERPARGEVAFKMGLCQAKLNMAANAAKSFQNALRYEYPDSTLFLYLGKALQASGKYKQAIEEYDKYLALVHDDALAREGVTGCRLAIAAKEQPKTRYVVKNQRYSTPNAPTSPPCISTNRSTSYISHQQRRKLPARNARRLRA